MTASAIPMVSARRKKQRNDPVDMPEVQAAASDAGDDAPPEKLGAAASQVCCLQTHAQVLGKQAGIYSACSLTAVEVMPLEPRRHLSAASAGSCRELHHHTCMSR